MKRATVLLLFATAISCTAQTQWVTTWATGMETPGGNAQILENKTVREIMRVSLGGDAVRVRISNRYGSSPLTISGAHIAQCEGAGVLAPGSDHPLTFDGKQSLALPRGADWWTDAVSISVKDRSDVCVSLFFANPVFAETQHTGALQTNYTAMGDQSSAAQLNDPQKLTTYPFVTSIEVASPKALGTIVALGDSITDGYSSHSDTNHRWPNLLADRLLAAKKPYGVANVGISSNRLLNDGPPNALYSPGANALARFDSDVLAQSGVTHVIVLEGINDLGHPGQGAPLQQTVSAEAIESAYLQLAERAHAHRIKLYVCTILPFEGTPYPGYYTPEKDAKRQQVNDWLRANARRFDGVIDLDKALRDPQHPSRLLPTYDSGDHLHPSDAGMQAIADAMPLELF